MSLETHYAWLVTGLLVLFLVADLRHDILRIIRGRNVVLVGIFTWFLLEGITLSPGLRAFPQDTYDFAIFCVLLAMMGFLMGYHATNGPSIFLRAGARISQLDDPSRLSRAVALASAIGFTALLIYSRMDLIAMFRSIIRMRSAATGGFQLTRKAWVGGFSDAMLMLEYFAYGAGAFAAVLLFNRRANLLVRFYCLPVCLWPLIRAAGGGTRYFMVLFFPPTFASIFFRLKPATQRWLVLGSLLLVVPVYHLQAAILATRNTGKFSWDAGYKTNYVGTEMLQEMCYISQRVPKQMDYIWGYTYFKEAINPIPRFLWPGKPVWDTSIQLAIWRGAVDAKGRLVMVNSPGMIGEMYFNFGVFGVFFLSMFGGWMVRGWDRFRDQYENSLCCMVFYCMGLAVLCMFGRSFTINLAYAPIFFYLATIPFTKSATALRTTQRSPQAWAPAPGQGSLAR